MRLREARRGQPSSRPGTCKRAPRALRSGALQGPGVEVTAWPGAWLWPVAGPGVPGDDDPW